MASNLKTIIYSALITLNLWVGDSILRGAIEGEKQAVRAVAQAYENYRCPLTVALNSPINNYEVKNDSSRQINRK